MSEAPAEMWLRQRPAPGQGWYQTALAPLEGSGVVRYVRADLYEALRRNEAPCREPWDVEYQAAERNPR